MNGMWVSDALTLAALLGQHEGGYFEVRIGNAENIYHLCRRCAPGLMAISPIPLRWIAFGSTTHCIACSFTKLPAARP